MSKFSQEEIRDMLKLYFIMGSTNCTQDPVYVLEEAIKGGITLFQFREKGENALIGEAKIDLARKLQKVCKKYQIPFIVNDDIDLALLLDADGVHIGQEDEAASAVRKTIGNKILGISAHNIEEVQLAIEDGADYLGMGPIFPTTTKLDAKEVQGTGGIYDVRSKGITIPIVGIGGISRENTGEVMRAGADGVSLISAISLSASPNESARELMGTIRLFS